MPLEILINSYHITRDSYTVSVTYKNCSCHHKFAQKHCMPAPFFNCLCYHILADKCPLSPLFLHNNSHQISRHYRFTQKSLVMDNLHKKRHNITDLHNNYTVFSTMCIKTTHITNLHKASYVTNEDDYMVQYENYIILIILMHCQQTFT